MPSGRPRDPRLDQVVRNAVISILAESGLSELTAQEVAAVAGCGKASIYRRWRGLDGLLRDVVENELGVRDVTYADGTDEMPGLTSTRDDLIRLLTAATTGARARAEAAILSAVRFDSELRRAYARGPLIRFFGFSRVAEKRAAERGEPWPMIDPVHVGWTSLMYRLATDGPLSEELVEDLVDRVILPALRPVVAVAS